MDGSAAWAAIGAVVVALIGVIGSRIAKANEKKSEEREITTSVAASLAREREQRPWAQLDDANDRLEDENERLVAENHRLRTERDALTAKLDAARIQAADWQIEAHKAAALRDHCEQERLRHAEEVKSLRAEIAARRGRR